MGGDNGFTFQAGNDDEADDVAPEAAPAADAPAPIKRRAPRRPRPTTEIAAAPAVDATDATEVTAATTPAEVTEHAAESASASAPESVDASAAEAVAIDVAAASTEIAAEVTPEPPVLSAPLVEELGLIERKSDQAAEIVDEPPPDTADLPPGELRMVVEGLLFVSTKPLSTTRLASCLPGTSEGYLDGFLTGLADRYALEQRGFELRREAGGWRLMTRSSIYPWVRQLERKELPTRLSRGALETLSVVAYKQPVTRGAIEDIRGVQCGPVLRQLMDLRLVTVVGRDDHALGRPLLYGTTDQFLTRFGLGSPADLPKRHEFG